MANEKTMLVEKPVRTVWRRMLLQGFVNRLLAYWAVGLVVVAVWFLVSPYLFGKMALENRWWVLGGVGMLAPLAAAIRTWWKAPSQLEAALALDSQFGLKERVTTSLTLTSEQLQTPAGQALMEDVNRHVKSLAVGSKFPLQVNWSSALMPIVAAVLAVLGLFFEPDLRQIDNPENNNRLSASETKDVEKELKRLEALQKKNIPDEEKSKAQKDLETEWKKLLDQPVEASNKEEVRKRVQELRNLEEMMKTRLEDLKSQTDMKDKIKGELQKLAKLDPDGKKSPDGPASDMMNAISKGDLQKAQEELEKLKKKLEEKKLSAEDLKKLADQMKNLQDKLKKLTDQKALKDQLKKEHEAGNLSDDQLQKALDQIMNSEEMQKLEELANQLGKCKACLQDGDLKELAEHLKKLGRCLGDLDPADLDEITQLEDAQKLLDEVCQGLCQCLGNKPDGRAGAPRPMGEEEETKHTKARQKVEVDGNADLKITGFTRGGTFSKISSKEVPTTFRRTAQEVQEALDRQRISPEEAEMLRGYFENLGNQKR